MEELLTGPVPKSTASYTLNYKVQRFSLQLGRGKIHPGYSYKARDGRSTQPGVWGASGDETVAQPRRCGDRPQPQAVVPLLALHLCCA